MSGHVYCHKIAYVFRGWHGNRKGLDIKEFGIKYYEMSIFFSALSLWLALACGGLRD